MNGHIGLIHTNLPATVDLNVTIPESHPSAQNLGSERVGSGTIVDPDGYILTVHYVTVGASSITGTLPDGDQYPADGGGQDAERPGLSALRPLLETLARSTSGLRTADWNDDATGELEGRKEPDAR